MTEFTKEQLIARLECHKETAASIAPTVQHLPAAYEMALIDIHLAEMALAALTTDPALEREQVRREHAEWSQATFGSVGPVGPLKHLSKEALEAAAEPGDLSEWADMQFLLWDAQRRAGITDAQIVAACIEKLAINKQRQWPEPQDGEPRLHVRSEEESLNARRRRNRESNARARERETPTQRKARLAKNRARMAIRRKGVAKCD